MNQPTANLRLATLQVGMGEETGAAQLMRFGRSLHRAGLVEQGRNASSSSRKRRSQRLSQVEMPAYERARVVFFTGLWVCVALSCVLALSL